jgi:threonyl-tRNA synthetase
VIREELERLVKDLARADGCESVYSPVLGKRALFERSGHWAKFSDDMFPPMPVGGDELVLRPANCPHHALIYSSVQRSYRDLPVRFNELAAMFRAERSGVLSGLSRVRQINLDDTHVFCRCLSITRAGCRCGLLRSRCACCRSAPNMMPC